VEEEKEGEVFASRRDDFVKPENHAPVHKVEGTSEIPKMVKLPKPVFHLDASRPRTWQSLMSRQKGKRPTLNKHGAGNLRVLSFDGRDDMIHSKPVLRSRDDSFTYIALFKPFNGNDNDSSRLGTIQQARWQLIAMVLNGKPTDNVIAIHNGSAPVITSIDMSKLKLGDEGFRIGNKLLNDSQQYRGHIAEIEVYNKALSSAQLEERLTTLQKKWGLKFKLQIPEMEAVQ